MGCEKARVDGPRADRLAVVTGRIALRMDAVQDMEEHFDWLAQQSRSVAVRFLDAVQATYEELAENGDLGIHWEFQEVHSPRLAKLRYQKVRGFPNHLIFYLPFSGGVEVLRILHSARDLVGIWNAAE